MSTIKIGLFGFGVVGEGIYNIVSTNPSLGFEIKKVVIKHPDKDRNAPKELFSTEAKDILEDPEIDLVVELIDNSDEAYSIVTEAMTNHKSVVSANKKMIAENHLQLIEIANKNNVSFLYEAAVCGSVPIIRNLEEYFDNDLLSSVKGIVNGSTNYILSKMKEGNSYEEALQNAQELGFAESNPSLDVEGIDASYKLSIISVHAFGKKINNEDILRKGITSLKSFDFTYAKEKNCVIKLLAKAHAGDQGKLSELSVLPTLVEENGTLGQTNNEFNGIILGSSFADEQFLYGKGAGRYPTSLAVLSDISAYKYGYRYEYKKGIEDLAFKHEESSRFYISFPKNKTFNESIFESIDEKFSNNERVYFTGKIIHQNLKKSGLLNDEEVSIISLN